jgi:hypothetical protein
MRTSDGQFGFVALGDLLGRWRRAMAVSAMFFARFAARRLGIGLRRPLAERRRLAFASAQGVLEQAGQFGDLGFKFRHAFGQRLATRTTRNRFHAVIVRKPPPLSCASFSTPTRNTQSTTLNNDDYAAIHKDNKSHKGIVVLRKIDSDLSRLVKMIDEALKTMMPLDGQLIYIPDISATQS